jgi:hypothetical protein
MGGHNIQAGSVSEDSDICERINAVGWDTHFIAQSYRVSIQHNTVTEFAVKRVVAQYMGIPDRLFAAQVRL